MIWTHQGLHKPRSFQENERLRQFGAFVQGQRWQLNISQASLAKMVDLSQSEIARIEQGFHQPRRYILEKLATVLSLQGWGRVKFYNLAGYYIDPKKWGIGEQQNLEKAYEEQVKRSNDDFIEFHTEYVKRIHQIRVEGNSRRALEMTWFASEKLSQAVREISSSKQYEKLFSLLAKALHEQGVAYSELSLPGELWTAKRSIIRQLKYVTNEPVNKDLLGLSDMFLGDAYYVVRKLPSAVKHLNIALQTIENIEARLILLTILGKSFAYLQQRKKFGEVEIQIRRIIDSNRCSNAELIGSALESIARSQIQLGLPTAYKSLDDVKGYCARFEKMPVVQMQVLRCELGFFKNQQVENSYFGGLAEKGLLLARQCDIARYVSHFKAFLEK